MSIRTWIGMSGRVAAMGAALLGLQCWMGMAAAAPALQVETATGGRAYWLASAAKRALPAQALATTTFSITGSSSGTPSNLSLTANISVASGDSGKTGNYYIAASVAPSNALWIYTTKGWAPYAGGAIPAYASNVPLSSLSIKVLDGTLDVSSLAGTVILAGYGTSDDDLLTGQKFAAIYTVPAQTTHILPQLLIEYTFYGGSYNLATHTGVPPTVQFWALLCWGSQCVNVGNAVTVSGDDQLDDPNLLDTIFKAIADAETGIDGVVSDLAKSGQYPPNSVMVSVIGDAVNTGVAQESVAAAVDKAKAGFKAAGYSASAGTSGGTTGGDCNLANYHGPNDDPQTATFCQTAYAYSCGGNTTAATKTCTLLNGFLQAISNDTAAQYCPNYCH